jgi:hypothetical protein
VVSAMALAIGVSAPNAFAIAIVKMSPVSSASPSFYRTFKARPVCFRTRPATGSGQLEPQRRKSRRSRPRPAGDACKMREPECAAAQVGSVCEVPWRVGSHRMRGRPRPRCVGSAELLGGGPEEDHWLAHRLGRGSSTELVESKVASGVGTARRLRSGARASRYKEVALAADAGQHAGG